jgi:hypothetical protein
VSSAERSPAASEESPISSSGGCFSCVVDDHPRFHLDALRWFTTLTEVAGVDAGDLVVHTVGAEHSDALDYLEGRGVAVRRVDRFDRRSPHCNKISGALSLADDPPAGTLVLCDTDTVVLEDPRPLALPPDAIGAKLVDAPLPPLSVMLEIFSAAHVSTPPVVDLPWGTDQTVAGNNNGGLYLIPGAILARVAPAWAHWARWLLDRAELLGQWTVHIDQVAMALALADTGTGSLALDVRWNTPSHDPSRFPADAEEPAIIHYHQQVDRCGRILPTGLDPIDRRIALANQAIDRLWPDGFPDSTYQRWLDLRGPEPTDGTGTKQAEPSGPRGTWRSIARRVPRRQRRPQ